MTHSLALVPKAMAAILYLLPSHPAPLSPTTAPLDSHI